MSKGHWKRIALGNAFVHVLTRDAGGTRWTTKILPDGVVRIWRGTTLVVEFFGITTKDAARARMDEEIRTAAYSEARS